MESVPEVSTKFCSDVDEPLLEHNDNRHTFSPILHNDAMYWYKTLNAVFWDTDGISLSNDYNTFKTLPPNTQHFIETTLAFFAASDGIVNENIQINLATNVQIPEFRAFYTAQMHNETVHSRMYAILLEEYIPDATKRNKLTSAIHTNSTINKKADFAFKYMTKCNSFAEIIVAFACVEGISFSGSFCAIFWFKYKGISLDGLIQSNEYISRDEGIHYTFAVMTYNSYIKNKLSIDKITQIVKEAVDIECEYITNALPENLEGMNANLMQTYIKFVADKTLIDFECPKVYNVENPFTWMESISIETKSNFFEKRVTSYQLADAVLESNFEITEDF